MKMNRKIIKKYQVSCYLLQPSSIDVKSADNMLNKIEKIFPNIKWKIKEWLYQKWL